MAHATDIVGYTYAADTYCHRTCVVEALKADGRVPDRSISVTDYQMGSTERILDDIALYTNDLGVVPEIVREDEHTFDSGDFPKIIFRSSLDDDSEHAPERCARCGELLGD